MDRKIKKILIIIPHRGIGDVIYHLPLLKSLYSHFNSKITIISNSENKSKEILFKENFLKKIIYFNFNRGNFFYYIKNIFKLRKIINSLKIDIVILTDPSKRLVIPVYLSNSKIKIISGVNSLFDFVLNKKSYRKKFLAQHIKDIMYLLKIDHYKNDYQLNYLLKKNDIINFTQFKRPWFFLNIDSHHNHNNWNTDYYKKIIKKLKNKTIFLNTSPRNINLIKSFKQEILNKNVIITSSFSIKKIIPIISNCELIIGNESGPICLASALNKKVLSIYNQNFSRPESKVISSKIELFNSSKLKNDNLLKIILKKIKKYY
jgi:ADP-heptose:LPS heptosyltransferase